MKAPAQKDLLTRRWRKVKPPRVMHDAIQESIADYLRMFARDDVQWWAVPNGGFRHKREAAKLKRLGQRPGVSDLQLRWRARWSLDCLTECLDMEIKADGDVQSDAQIEWERASKATGTHYVVVRSLAEAIAVFDRYGVTRLWQSRPPL